MVRLGWVNFFKMQERLAAFGSLRIAGINFAHLSYGFPEQALLGEGGLVRAGARWG